MNERSLKNSSKPELEEIHRPPLTIKELRQRLKHIAGLCWGLSIDLQNEIESKAAIIAEFEKLGTENEELKTQLETAQSELIKCNDIAKQDELLKLENERLKQALAMERAKNKRAAIDDHAEQLAWERKTYGNTTCELTNGHKRKKGVNKKKLAAEQARAKRKAEFEALPEKERERRLKKRMYQQRYMEKKRAERTQGGNNGSNQN